MSTSRTVTLWWVPLLGSFAVYLVPLVGPHAMTFVGEGLLQELTRGGTRNPWWVAADVGVALLAQTAVGLALFWSLRGSRVRLFTWFALVPVLVAGLNTAYLVTIPTYFLIEPDTAPEVASWEEHCAIPNVSLMPVRMPATQPIGGVRSSWLQRPDGQYALLRVPGCEVMDAGLPVPTVQPGGRVGFMLGFQFVAADGAATLERLVPNTSERTWWLLSRPGEPLMPIDQPALGDAHPILSNTADAVAWLERVAGSPPPVLERVTVQALYPSATLDRQDIELTSFGPASYTLLDVDTAAREVLLWRNDRPLLLGFDGQRRDVAFTPGSIRAQATTYLRHRTGWMAWDAYKEEGPYQLSWALAAGSGTHRTNNGRSITAAAVNPSGTLIAMSETTTLNIGSARDVIYVLRAGDGSEVFRVYLPRYARSPVVFYEGGFFGYSDLTGVHVLKIPG